MILGADECRAADGAQRLGGPERKLPETPVAQDKARARVVADFRKLDAQLPTEFDDRRRGEQRVGRTLGHAVLRLNGLNHSARAPALFEKGDFVALLVERVRREQPGDTRADDRRLSPRLVERADHTFASFSIERRTAGNSGSPLKARAR